MVVLGFGGLWAIAYWYSRWTLRLTAVVAILLGVVVLSRTSTPEERDAKPCADADHLLDEGHLALLLRKPPTLTGGGARAAAWAREDKCEQDASAAVRALGEAVSDPSRPFAVGGLPWLLYDDPDLTHLRRHPAFADWVEARFGERPEPDPDWGATLRSRFGTLHRCAAKIVDQGPAGSAGSNGDLAAAEKGRWSALADWASSPKSAWAAEGLKRAFGAEVDANGPESLDAVDVEALEDAWRWIVPVVIDVRDHWSSRPSEPTGLFGPKASRRVWRALALYASRPDSGRRRCLLEGALGKGPLVDALGTASSVTSAPSGGAVVSR